MKEEHNIVQLVLSAKEDGNAADFLIEQYLPYIQGQAAQFHMPGQEEDALSIAMFAFYEAVLDYERGRGSFLKLAAVYIKNRIIDYNRKQTRHRGHLSLETPTSQEDERTLGMTLADARQDGELALQREATAQEIGHFSLQLADFGLNLTDIAQNCPKQERTMQACMRVLDYARSHPKLLEQLVQTRKLPLQQLAQGAGVERKTLERHRKYLVAILLAYTNGFEILRGHLSLLKGKEVAAQ